jgi:3'-phosphoadenosine 5'-phosphosulfate sulfotransferase (PAPS reductase)/FAD synthetase
MSLRIFPKVRKIPAKKPKTYILFPFEMHEKMRETFEQKEAESLQLIKNHLEAFKKPYIASSHGKDSIVMVHLVWRAAKELGVQMPEVWLNNTLNIYKEEPKYWKEFNAWLGIEDRFRVFHPPEYEGKPETVWSIAKRYGLPKFRRKSNGTKLGYKETNIPKCCEILKKQSIKKYLQGLPKDERYDLNFVGTRAQESQNRSNLLLQRCRSYFKKTRGAYPIQTCTPLSFWKATDILEYFHRYNIPKNPTYEIHNIQRMGCASCPAHIGWEERLARDPTEEGFGMLKLNLEILKKTDQERLKESLAKLDLFCKHNSLNEHQRNRLIELLRSYDNRIVMSDFF